MSKEPHLIADLSFRGLWCRCTCGELLVSENVDLMPIEWKQHRLSYGLVQTSSSLGPKDETAWERYRMRVIE